ncbi:hypothetical protein NPIL_506521 [Nephila pilipes]|uniref:Uncharacterized protein n=1 Tax=Nephila pilipes TaxID=299642 RepID=A0A8X6QDV8_NEPPI|nr:hypothetical protein NPIL_506521 [Nephila pilipes]
MKQPQGARNESDKGVHCISLTVSVREWLHHPANSTNSTDIQPPINLSGGHYSSSIKRENLETIRPIVEIAPASNSGDGPRKAEWALCRNHNKIVKATRHRKFWPFQVIQ